MPIQLVPHQCPNLFELEPASQITVANPCYNCLDLLYLLCLISCCQLFLHLTMLTRLTLADLAWTNYSCWVNVVDFAWASLP